MMYRRICGTYLHKIWYTGRCISNSMHLEALNLKFNLDKSCNFLEDKFKSRVVNFSYYHDHVA